jgi:hypothetical protein
MNFKSLTIAAAIVVMSSLGSVAPVYAQAAPAPAAAAPAPDAAAPAAPAPAADAAPAPAGDAAKPGSAAAAADQSTPYGLGHIWQTGSWISKAILIVLGIMSAGTWYIFFTKFIDQQRILGQAKIMSLKNRAAGRGDAEIETACRDGDRDRRRGVEINEIDIEVIGGEVALVLGDEETAIAGRLDHADGDFFRRGESGGGDGARQ